MLDRRSMSIAAAVVVLVFLASGLLGGGSRHADPSLVVAGTESGRDQAVSSEKSSCNGTDKGHKGKGGDGGGEASSPSHDGEFWWPVHRCAPGDGLPGKERQFCFRTVGGARHNDAIRILALGDSLTEGFVHSPGMAAFWPYAYQLAFEFPSRGVVAEAGLSGEFTGTMADRLDLILAAGARFDVISILGGTNDFLSKVPSSKIIANLWRMHTAAHAAGAKTIALTIPQADVSPALLDVAAAVNSDLVARCAEAAPMCRAVRLDVLFPFSPDLFSDHVHFSKTGYEAVGTVIAEAIRAAGWDSVTHNSRDPAQDPVA